MKRVRVSLPCFNAGHGPVFEISKKHNKPSRQHRIVGLADFLIVVCVLYQCRPVQKLCRLANKLYRKPFSHANIKITLVPAYEIRKRRQVREYIQGIDPRPSRKLIRQDKVGRRAV